MKLLILDLDGTVRCPKSGAKFINDPLDQEIIPEAGIAIADYKSQGWIIVGATNQGGVAAGHKQLEDAIINPLTFEEIADICECNPQTASQILNALEQGGMNIQMDKASAYAPTGRPRKLARR